MAVTLPTDGNPINATLASPDFITSNPSPFAWPIVIMCLLITVNSLTLPAPLLGASINWALYFASLALSKPKWYSVAARARDTW